jgi:integrase/recombinase XerD
MRLKETLPVYRREMVGRIVVSAICDDRRTVANKDDKKGEYYPIKIRIIYERFANYLSTKKMFTLETWNDICNENCRKVNVKDIIRPELDKLVEKTVSIVKDLSNRKCYSFEDAKERFYSVSVSIDDETRIVNLFEQKITSLIEKEKFNTATTYKSTLLALTEFRGNKVSIDAIDMEWLLKFEKYLRKNGRNDTTIGIYMRNLRHILKTCIPDKLDAEAFPFGADKYNIPSGTSRDMALNKDQLRQIRDFDDGLEGTRQYRDLWLFSFYCCGANLADILRFKWDDISNDEIAFFRHKTADRTKEKRPIYVTLDDDMWSIINEWGNKRKKGSYIFPYLNGITDELAITKRVADVTRRVNRHISKIGKALELGNISTYTARHSFASVTMWEGASIGYISQSLGHTNISTTNAYLEQFRPEKRREEHDKVKL